MSFQQIKNQLREQLQARGLAGARLHGRTEELPFERPLAEWRAGEREIRADFNRAAVQLIEEIPENGWTADTIEWLMGFVERAKIREAVDALETVVHRNKWLTAVDDGPRAHMLALRTLRGLWWKVDPNFWLRLPPDFQKRFPALVFGGLADHNFDLAFRHLPAIATDTTAAREISRLLASLIETKGTNAIWAKLRAVQNDLQPKVAQLFKSWFEVRGYPVSDSDDDSSGGSPDTGWALCSSNGPLLQSLMYKPPAGAPA